MAVIDEYYSSRLDVGPPAAVALLAGFMGERERMNRAIIDQMLATSDPKALADAEADARKAKNDLLKLKAEVSMSDKKADTSLMRELIRYRGTERTAQSSERRAAIAARAMLARAYTNDEDYRQKQIQEGDTASQGQLGIVQQPAVGKAEADRTTQYMDKIDAASSAAGASGKGLSGVARQAAQARIAQTAYETATKAGHKAEAQAIKDKYFGGQEPAVYRETNFRRKTEPEIDERVRSAPLGGAAGNQDIVEALASDTGVSTEEMQRRIYGATDASGKPLFSADAPKLSGDELAATGVAALGGAAPGQAPQSEIDAAIAEIDAEIKDLKAQRGRGVSLQDVAARRYPNYLYANPFQVRSRAFDQFRRETEELSPEAAGRYVRALGEQEGPFPVLRATRELERTEPIRRAGGIDFVKEGVDLSTSSGAIQPLADALAKADEMSKDSNGVKVGDETVKFRPDPKGVPTVIVKDKGGKEKTFSSGDPKQQADFQRYVEGMQQSVFEQSGLKDAYEVLPGSFSQQYLAPVMAALQTPGGFAAAKTEADRILAGGDVSLSDIYMQALREARGIEDPRARDEAISDLAERIPESESIAPALKRINETQDPEALVNSAGSLLQAYNAAKGDVAAGETTVFEARTAREGQTAAREEREVARVPEVVRALEEGVPVPGLGTVRRTDLGVELRPSGSETFIRLPSGKPAAAEALSRAQAVVKSSVPAPPEPVLPAPAALPATATREMPEADLEAVLAMPAAPVGGKSMAAAPSVFGKGGAASAEASVRQAELVGQQKLAADLEALRAAGGAASASAIEATRASAPPPQTPPATEPFSGSSGKPWAGPSPGEGTVPISLLTPEQMLSATRLGNTAPDAVIPGYTTTGGRPVPEGMPPGSAITGQEERRGADPSVEAMPPTPKPAPAKPAPAKPAPAKPAPAKPAPAKPAPKPAPAPTKPRFTQAEIDAAAQMLED